MGSGAGISNQYEVGAFHADEVLYITIGPGQLGSFYPR